MNTGQKKSHLEHRTAWYRTSCSHTLIKRSSSLRHTEASNSAMVLRVIYTLLKVKHECHVKKSSYQLVLLYWAVRRMSCWHISGWWRLVLDVSGHCRWSVYWCVQRGIPANACTWTAPLNTRPLPDSTNTQTHTHTGYMDSTSLTIQLIMSLLTI